MGENREGGEKGTQDIPNTELGAQDTQQLRVVDCCILLTAPKFKGSS